MANLRGLGQVSEMLLKSHLASKQAQQEDEMIRARAEENAQRNSGQLVLERALKDPKFALAARQAGVQGLSGLPIDTMAATGADLGAPEMKAVADAKTPIPIEQLMAQRRAEGPVITQTDQSGMSSLPDLAAVTDLITANQAHTQQLGVNRGTAIDDAGASAQATAFGTGTGTNAAANANEPDTLARVHAAGEQANALDVEHQKELNPVLAARAGQEAGARFPWEEKLTQMRANTSLLNQQAMDKWKQEHPTATAQELNRKSVADAALSSIGEVRTMLDEMDKRGMLGDVRGHAYELFSGTLKSEDIFKTPEDAKLAADFFSSMGLLRTTAAAASGGGRGASPQLIQAFEKIVSGVGDKSLTTGQLDSLERLMRVYADKPNSPEIDPKQYGLDANDPRVSATIAIPPGLGRLLGGP